MEDIPIAEHVEACFREFSKVCTGLAGADIAMKRKILPYIILDELGRFRLWCGNVAAHQKGKRGLDNKLREASHIRDQVVDLLVNLQKVLGEAFEIIAGQRVPWEDMSDSGSDISEEDPPSPGDNEEVGLTELRQLASNMAEIVTCLMRLSIAIRNPAPHDQYKGSKNIDTSYYESFDIEHVRGKFPEAQEYLVQRLGKAISRRRQYLRYREEHHRKLRQGLPQADPATILASEGTLPPSERCESTIESTIASSIPLPIKSRSLAIELTEPDYYEDILSQTSYASSANESKAFRPPSLPSEGQDGNPFECPICFRLTSVRETSAWHKHVYRDLKPYVCSYRECKQPESTFESRHDWFEHEMSHRQGWECIDGCNLLFQSEDDLRTHLCHIHPEWASGDRLDDLIRTCIRKPDITSGGDCVLCLRTCASLPQLRRHLGKHHDNLALFALPNHMKAGPDNSDEEKNGDGSTSMPDSASNKSVTESEIEGLGICDVCKITKMVSNCNHCDFHFCDRCWALQPQHKPGKVGRDGVPHQRSLPKRFSVAVDVTTQTSFNSSEPTHEDVEEALDLPNRGSEINLGQDQSMPLVICEDFLKGICNARANCHHEHVNLDGSRIAGLENGYSSIRCAKGFDTKHVPLLTFCPPCGAIVCDSCWVSQHINSSTGAFIHHKKHSAFTGGLLGFQNQDTESRAGRAVRHVPTFEVSTSEGPAMYFYVGDCARALDCSVKRLFQLYPALRQLEEREEEKYHYDEIYRQHVDFLFGPILPAVQSSYYIRHVTFDGSEIEKGPFDKPEEKETLELVREKDELDSNATSQPLLESEERPGRGVDGTHIQPRSPVPNETFSNQRMDQNKPPSAYPRSDQEKWTDDFQDLATRVNQSYCKNELPFIIANDPSEFKAKNFVRKNRTNIMATYLEERKDNQSHKQMAQTSRVKSPPEVPESIFNRVRPLPQRGAYCVVDAAVEPTEQPPRFKEKDQVNLTEIVDGIRVKRTCKVSKRRFESQRGYWEYQLQYPGINTPYKKGAWICEREVRRSAKPSTETNPESNFSGAPLLEDVDVAEPSIETDLASHFSGVPLLEDVNDVLQRRDKITQPGFECTFWFLGCSYISLDEDKWRAHCLIHFKGQEPPRTVQCPLCEDFEYASDSGHYSWSRRMDHIAYHYTALGDTLRTSRPDKHLFQHLWQKGIIGDEEFMQLKKDHILTRALNDVTVQITRKKQARERARKEPDLRAAHNSHDAEVGVEALRLVE